MSPKLKAIPLSILLALAGCNDSEEKKRVVINDCEQDSSCETVPNVAPSISIIAPSTELSINAGEALTVSTIAEDADSNIKRVDFYWNGAFITSVISAPYTLENFYVPVNATLGKNTIVAMVVDTQDEVAQATVDIDVTAALKPPTIELVLPTHKTPLVLNESLSLEVLATDQDGSIDRVEYYLDGELIGQSTTAPNYSIDYTLMSFGFKKLTMKAFDNDGQLHQVDTMISVAKTHQTLLIKPSQVYFKSEAPYDEITVFWGDNSENEKGFKVEQKIEGSDTWTNIGQAGENETELTISNFDRTETSYIRVKALRDDLESESSEMLRLVGTNDTLEVYPVIPEISSGKTLSTNKQVYNSEGTLVTRKITYPAFQYQTPNERGQGQATRASSYFSVEVKTLDSELLSSPVYETRPQIRNFLAQNDKRHTGQDKPYQAGRYGVVEGELNSSIHSKHWTNIDASEDVIVRVKLDPTMGAIDISDLEIHPAPIDTVKIDEQTFDVTLPGATDFTRHYRIAVNRKAWAESEQSEYRGSITIESPLFVFINPVHLAPASAPMGQVKEFNDGALVVFGAGVHLPKTEYQFLGEGGAVAGGATGNDKVREIYAPGDAYLQYGFLFKNNSYPIKAWGRAIYSDEMFNVYTEDDKAGDADGYVWSDRARSPWSHLDATEGNPWQITHASNPHMVLDGSYTAEPTVIDGFTNISTTTGILVTNGQSVIKNYKDVGYGGGTYQSGSAKVEYTGNLFVNSGDITQLHKDITMSNNTSYNLYTGASFQLGTDLETEMGITAQVSNHTVLSSDRLNDELLSSQSVFNSQLTAAKLVEHAGGVFENFEFYGQESSIFNIQVWNREEQATDTTSIISDKTFKNFNVRQAPVNAENLIAESDLSLNQQAYIRFIHFDNLVIEGTAINNASDFDSYFNYNEGLLLHTVTLFSMPSMIDESSVVNGYASAPIDQYVAIKADNMSYVQSDESLPASFNPLTANASSDNDGFVVVSAGDDYVALRDFSGRYVQADPNRYGYVHVQLEPSDDISEWAKFIWVDNGDSTFSLFSKATGLYVRLEDSLSTNAPLYAASDEITASESFEFEAHSGEAPVFGKPPISVKLEAEEYARVGDSTGEKADALKPTNGADGGSALGWVGADDWAEFDVNMSDVAYIKIKSLTAGFQNRDLEVSVNGVSLGVIPAKSSGNWGTYVWSEEAKLNAPSGGVISTLRITAPGDGINLDAFDVTFVRYNAQELNFNAGSFDSETGGIKATGGGVNIGFVKNDRSVSYNLNLDASSIDTKATLELVGGSVKAGTVITFLADDVEIGSATTPVAGPQTISTMLSTAGNTGIGTLKIVFTHPTDTGFLLDVSTIKLEYGVVDTIKVVENLVLDSASATEILTAKTDKLDNIKDMASATYNVELKPGDADIKVTMEHVGGGGAAVSFYGILSDDTEEMLGTVNLPGGGGWSDPYLIAEGVLDAVRTEGTYKALRFVFDNNGTYCCNVGSVQLEYEYLP
ncbi:Ig-like domain-containing protein [Catenovulum maritimum]|uniref:CBM6 domain-containing protein n=1 Tax=Catenovulum maritimum TaxID=1513271 RepID=A0A0J8GVZ6_9ALTE|nr:Ig-like domain-containing protein [Catenovulum maritimum]KMT65474.1 hypothetical protein XM47_08980 [Catenovulum maritimum]